MDFYNSPIPTHDFLLTNPPYSGEHKQRILEFCVKQRRPFALLVPNYVTVKQYFKVCSQPCSPPQEATNKLGRQMFFLVPRTR